MCEVTPREAKRRAIKDKLGHLREGPNNDPQVAELLKLFLDLDEEAQKATLPPPVYVPSPYYLYPVYPYQPWYWPPYKITVTNNTSTGHYPAETTTASL